MVPFLIGERGVEIQIGKSILRREISNSPPARSVAPHLVRSSAVP